MATHGFTHRQAGRRQPSFFSPLAKKTLVESVAHDCLRLSRTNVVLLRAVTISFLFILGNIGRLAAIHKPVA